MRFFLNLGHCVQSYKHILLNFGSFYDVRLLNMVMSRDPRCKFRNFYFVLILHLILGKVTKVLVEKLSASEVTSRGGGGGGGGTPPSAFGVNA